MLLDQQPDRSCSGALTALPAVARPDPQPGEVARQFALGPLSPRHAAAVAYGGQVARRTGRREPSANWGRRPRPPAGRATSATPNAVVSVKTTSLSVTPDDVRQAPARQAVAEVPGNPIARIGDDRLAGKPFGPHRVEQFQGDLALGQLPPLLLGNPRALSSRLGSVEPAFGQVEAHRQRVVPPRADVMDRDGHLAVGLLAQGAAVLPLDADGVLALLGEGDIVEEEDAVGVAKVPAM